MNPAAEGGGVVEQESRHIYILLIEQDEWLIGDALGFEHSRVSFLHGDNTPAQVDAIVIGVDAPDGFERLAQLVRSAGAPPVIAIAGRGADGASLEHVLLRAELRGAALSVPRPVDAAELAYAALDLLAREAPQDRDIRVLADDVGRRVAA